MSDETQDLEHTEQPQPSGEELLEDKQKDAAMHDGATPSEPLIDAEQKGFLDGQNETVTRNAFTDVSTYPRKKYNQQGYVK